MPSSRPLLARSNMAASATATPTSSNNNNNNPQAGPGSRIPSIRLISATPSAAAGASDSSTSFNQSLEVSWQSVVSQPSPLAPKIDLGNQPPRKRLVPKKSKLSILGMGGGGREKEKHKERAKDFSDVVRRIGASPPSTRGGFEIYVDPTVDPDIGEIVMIKKQKSRVALDGMTWGALGEATNVPKAMKEELSKTQQPVNARGKENPAFLKVKVEEERKWWSIGRGRKDSKERTKEKENKMSTNSKPVEYVFNSTDTYQSTNTLKVSPESRGRFNSLDSDMLLSKSNNSKGLPARSQTPTVPYSEPESSAIPERARSATPSAGLFFRSATPTAEGLLAPPGHKLAEDKSSIALRAIRSMRSLAHIGSWAQLKSSSSSSSKPTAQELAEEMGMERGEREKKEEKKQKDRDGTVKKKKGKKSEKEDGEKKKKIKKKKKEMAEEQEETGTVKRKSVKKDKQQDKTNTMRISTSSFEIGHLSASPVAPKTLGTKKHSILGLGLPSTMRLPRMRGGSTASSLNLVGQANPGAPPATAAVNPTNAPPPDSNRLSVENSGIGRDRAPSAVSSNGSSLRPVSVASSNSRNSRMSSSGSSVLSGTSVRWDEDGLEAVREQRRKERDERRSSSSDDPHGTESRRTSKESSRRSLGGQRRTPLSAIFPEVHHHHQIGTAMLQDVKEEDSKLSDVQLLGDGGSESDAFSTMSANTTSSSMVMRRRTCGAYPILTIEEATADGHGEEGHGTTTPVKRRVRPLSEQLLGKTRPKAMHEDEDGVHSILTRATDDLALLLDTLHLEASPGTPDVSPVQARNQKQATVRERGYPRPPETESPLKKTLRSQGSSIRPYAQSRGYPKRSTSSNEVAALATTATKTKTTIDTVPPPPPPPSSSQTNAALIGQPISPWPVLMAAVSPEKKNKEFANTTAPTITTPPLQKATPPSTFRPGHKRTMTPAPEPEPEPVLQPLKPASRSKVVRPDSVFGGGQPTIIRPANAGVLSEIGSSPSYTDRTTTTTTTTTSRRSSMTADHLSSSPTGSSLTPLFKQVLRGVGADPYKRESLCPADYRGKRAHVVSLRRRRSSSSGSSQELVGGGDSYLESFSLPIGRDVRKALRMSGTLGGGSDVSGFDDEDEEEGEGEGEGVPSLDPSDPDADVPEELRFILATHSDRESIAESLSFQVDDDVPSAAAALDVSFAGGPSFSLGGEPPLLLSSSLPSPLDHHHHHHHHPVFRAALIDEDENRFDLVDGGGDVNSDEETKKSFDFTGELEKLNESGASDRASFVEQLEIAFKTPAKVDLRCDFGTQLPGPVVPPLPPSKDDREEEDYSTHPTASDFDLLPSQSHSQLLDVEQPTTLQEEEESLERARFISHHHGGDSEFDDLSVSRLVDVQEPTFSDLDGFAQQSYLDRSDVDGQEEEGGLSVDELASSTDSRPSNGELDRSFKFGGRPRDDVPTASQDNNYKNSEPLNLSDIIPPLDYARVLSEASLLDNLDDESVLKSIYAKLRVKGTTNGDASSSSSATDLDEFKFDKMVSRPASGVSFAGLDSFDEVRRGFEFSGDRSFYPPPASRATTTTAAAAAAGGTRSRAPHHRREESVFSIASVSSYGRVLNNGSSDPFDYGLPSLQERPSFEDISISVDDTFAFIRNQQQQQQPLRKRVESDASSFYFRDARGHRRRESSISVGSHGAPPISMYNRSSGHHHHHRRNESTSSSIALSYAKYGANSGFSAWARQQQQHHQHQQYQHRRDVSADSVSSEFSSMHLGRPGIGDKMFDRTVDLGPLTSISASPPEQQQQEVSSESRLERTSSFDSILDGEQRPSMEGEDEEDSLFVKTALYSSMFFESVFGNGDGNGNSRSSDGELMMPPQFRPISSLSVNTVYSSMEDGDTMISMIGGGHVRRRSIGIDASPCVRVEKRKHLEASRKVVEPTMNKAVIVEKPWISSTASFEFGGDRMIKARQGLLERQSLEDSCFVADGEDVSGYRLPVFTRPFPARSRSSTCTSSSGADTPPLSCSDGSLSEGSQSSIDLGQVDVALANATHPLPNVQRNRVRARGSGHRRRYSKAHVSRSSVYETIEEEAISPAKSILSKDDATSRQPVYVVDSDTVSIGSKLEESVWDDERGIVALRKFYALRDEATDTVTESRRVWLDTPFSIFALQSFHPPDHPAAMKALLEHSVQSYGPLPSELRPRRIRSRTSSRPSPYPQNRISKQQLTLSAEQFERKESSATPVLRSLPFDSNLPSAVAPALGPLKPFSPLAVDAGEFNKHDNNTSTTMTTTLPLQIIRPRVGSTARRTALGWAKKRSAKSSSEYRKENVVVVVGKENVCGVGMITTPGDTLRLNRPRPKGRTPGHGGGGGRTAASQNRLLLRI